MDHLPPRGACESVVLAAVRTIESIYGPLRSLSFVTEDGTEVVTRPAPPHQRRFTFPEPPPKPAAVATHSPDYRSVTVQGQELPFTGAQAAVVRQLWEAYEDGTSELGQETLLEGAGLDSSRLRDVFKTGGAMHPAWGSLIVPGSTKGSFRLNLDVDFRN